VAIGNAIFVRNRNSLTNNEQSMRSFAIQTGPQIRGLQIRGPDGLIGYCLISNHVHLIAIPRKADG